MARTHRVAGRQVTVEPHQLTVDGPLTAAQAEAIKAAWAEYLARTGALLSVRECPAHWPADPPGPDYVGTRCQLLDGHADRDGSKHRHRITGTQTIVEWT